ncbi:HD domain-containing protein [Novosphingobium huizhouense]|uniref:HD domain-containing protein n=1 Tax=Novosphingobium huizhouense TaxID=2866625 RepID=UPI001CD846C5|nr:HD domain-containing protein [Novosphingobium huizhouense]
MTDLTHRFEDALGLATRLHRTQRRKGTDIPYVAHLLGVAAIALELGADEDQGGAPVLAEIEARFGPRVAGMVAANTDGTPDAATGEKAPWRARKLAYIAGMADKDADALLVSLADKTHNARAIVDDLALHGEALWARFNGGRDGTLWYYDALAEAFVRHLPGPGADRLRAVVREMHVLARELPA